MLKPLRPMLPHLALSRPAAQDFLARHAGLIVCALFLLVGLATAGDYGIVGDELIQRQIARANLDYILGRTDYGGILVKAEVNDQQLVPSDRYYGVAFELPLLLAEQALGLEDYRPIHRIRLTLTHLFFIVGGFFCYLLAYRLFGSRLIALFALLIFLLHPRIYGHASFNSKDPVFLSMLVIALYLLERAFRRDTLGAFLLLGIGVGLLTNLRIMGVMLVFAVIALRGLDWFYANTGPERKGILLTAGLFVLAAGLTLYALSPYAWANPVDYLAASLDLTVNHPVVWPQLFQGEWFPSDQLPPHYNAVWFAIATPLPIMLLGGMGVVVAAVRGGRRPLAALADKRRRFLLLLLAGFLLPPLAVALLGSNQYNDWRHLYFVYVPFGLLAAGGLHWLAAGRRRPWRAGVYGLTAAGLGLIVLQITQLHPLQLLYFNSLVERTAPERLRAQYHFSFWELAYWAALKDVLKNHPGETLTVRTAFADEFDLLSPADRTRLRPVPEGGGQADYYMLTTLATGQPDFAFNAGYRPIYNNAVTVLRPLDSARMSAAAVAAYQEIYRQAVAGEPIIQADYNVYRQGSRLTFVRENCPPDSPDAWFAARPFPPDPETRPPNAREIEFYISYNLSNHGVRLGDICLAVIQLPDNLRGDIILSQHRLGAFHPTGPPLWEKLYSLSPHGLRERIGRLRQASPPAADNAFEVLLDRDAAGRQRLLYVKENCARAEYETAVFLHIYPENRGDLPFYRWAGGGAFTHREFPLHRYGVRLAGECLAVVPLPDYPVESLLTGQTGIWEKRIYTPADPEALRAAYAALSDRQPAAQPDFALYIRDNQLTYRRESCAVADTAARFFLHIIPRDAAALPEERRQEGYADLNFDFARWGGHFDGKCLATVPLPEYPIAVIRTGQAHRWKKSFYPPADPDYLRAAYAALSDRPPVARADFDLYVQDNRLIYRRESCAVADTAAGFFLHIIPQDVADLPRERQAAGFANADFVFVRWGGAFDGKCLAAVPLPEYPIAVIRTGQRVPGPGGGWSVELIPAPDPDRLRAAQAALSDRQPDASADFDLYVQDNQLIYRRESCTVADMAAGFFLHIVPVDIADLPAERQTAGFANADFVFVRYGGAFDGKCLATVPLPEYPIAAIRTGQYVPGQGELWAAELAGER